MVKAAGSTLTGAQLRAARALIGMRAEDLAQESKVSLRTIRRAEAENGPAKMTSANLAALTDAFLKRGVRFIKTRDESLGVAISQISQR